MRDLRELHKDNHTRKRMTDMAIQKLIALKWTWAVQYLIQYLSNTDVYNQTIVLQFITIISLLSLSTTRASHGACEECEPVYEDSAAFAELWQISSCFNNDGISKVSWDFSRAEWGSPRHLVCHSGQQLLHRIQRPTKFKASSLSSRLVKLEMLQRSVIFPRPVIHCRLKELACGISPVFLIRGFDDEAIESACDQLPRPWDYLSELQLLSMLSVVLPNCIMSDLLQIFLLLLSIDRSRSSTNCTFLIFQWLGIPNPFCNFHIVSCFGHRVF